MRRWIARFRFVIALAGPIIAIALTAPVTAQTQPDSALDALFDQLRTAPDAATAQGISNQIWDRWTHPDDFSLYTRMIDVLEMRQRRGPADVIGLLDDIIADHPNYAEAWNQRATMYYLLGDYERSLADIEKALQFEPRHFGALAGRAVIYQSQGKDELALKDIIAALAIHPFLAERSLFPELEDMKFI
jgi:tetratricopeptide (TPR) repeat protein